MTASIGLREGRVIGKIKWNGGGRNASCLSMHIRNHDADRVRMVKQSTLATCCWALSCFSISAMPETDRLHAPRSRFGRRVGAFQAPLDCLNGLVNCHSDRHATEVLKLPCALARSRFGPLGKLAQLYFRGTQSVLSNFVAGPET